MSLPEMLFRIPAKCYKFIKRCFRLAGFNNTKEDTGWNAYFGKLKSKLR